MDGVQTLRLCRVCPQVLVPSEDATSVTGILWEMDENVEAPDTVSSGVVGSLLHCDLTR